MKGSKSVDVMQVGYAASKVVFNRTWRMTITAGERGPIFTVSTTSSASCCWTCVMMAQIAACAPDDKQRAGID